MNERIKELAEQSSENLSNVIRNDEWLQKFAELIVRECLGIINKEHDEGIDRHGDYQLALYEAYREIKEHFGVK